MLYEMTDMQRKVYIDTAQVYTAYMYAFENARKYKGGMHWKKAKGRKYLFRTHDRYGNGKSLGPRSAETEKIFTQFHKAKKEAKAKLNGLKERLKEQSRFSKAAIINRVPKIVTGILRMLHHHKLLGRNIVLAGTNAMYAYEAMAGVFLDSPLVATMDMDILWDPRTKVKLVADRDQDHSGLLGILRKIDKTFELIQAGSFRAVNANGYMVDLIKPAPKYIHLKDPVRIGGVDDLKAVEIQKLHWLLSAPKLSQIVIGDDGYPAEMIVPDPRVFALHKLWLADQKEREPIKKRRDRAQGEAIIKIIFEYLPQYKFSSSELRMFPKDLIDNAMEKVSNMKLPDDLNP